MALTKTTFHLSADLHRRLKTAAARRGITVSKILAEGAELALARLETRGDREELLRRARAAGEALRRGLYEGPAISGAADEVVYGAGRDAGRRAGKA